MTRLSPRALSLVVATFALLVMAPTVGDTGACGRTATELDRDRYANARKLQDCERCRECGLDTARCLRACDKTQLPEIALPATCRPLYHDGEVCLRALAAASCDTYATYVDDESAATPTECDFCQVPPAAPAGTLGDGAAP
ncbi:MAG: hypothetical protein JWP87_6221 [Labilithrix sp.]|nr:hypothetical protein [Labilithrix sp.]